MSARHSRGWRGVIGAAVVGCLPLLGWASAADASPHGGSGGTAFNVSCGSGAVLVGAIGGAGTYVDRIQPVCVKVKSDGSWDGATFTLGTFGTGGGFYQKICPQNQAVVGIKGKSGSLVDQLELGCGTLGVVSGQVKILAVKSTLGPVGGSGGAAFTDLCPTGQIVLGMSGRSGAKIDQIDRACGTISAPATAALTVSFTTNPVSTASQYVECNTAVGISASAQGGPPGTMEYQLLWYRAFYGGTAAAAQGDSGIIKNWGTGNTASWTPPSAGIFKVRALARVGGVQASQDHNVYVRLPITWSLSPTSPTTGPSRVTVTATPTASCVPPSSTVWYQFKLISSARTAEHTGYIASPWTSPDPALPAGSYTFRYFAGASRSTGSYDGNKLLAISQTQNVTSPMYVVGGTTTTVAKFSELLMPAFQHDRCKNCHGFFATSNPVKDTLTTPTNHATFTTATTCTSCHSQGAGWHAPPGSFDLRGKSQQQLCDAAKTAPAGNTVQGHLRGDPLILWAIGNGQLPNGTTAALAPPGIASTWQERVDRWVGGGMSCQ